MKRSFTPRARLVSILGDQLIKDDVVGLLELVKNGYDADAKSVTVRILNTADPEKTEIWVQDDGYGMDLDTIENHWLQPASGHKERTKRNLRRSELGRLPQGEKGVGRFAVQRLARFLTLVTRPKGQPQEIVIQIDWAQFDDEEKRLSDVEFEVTLRNPEIFIDGSGTALQMKGTRIQWQEKHIKRVHRYLERMMPPFDTVRDFRVEFECPDFPKFGQFNPGRITEHSHFYFSGTVDERGMLLFDYRFHVPGFDDRELVQQSVDLVQSCERWEDVEQLPLCGPFKLQVYGWHRRDEVMSLTPEVNKGELNDRCGVAVYRDGIRVLPYGESGDDWLELDLQRINTPEQRLGNRNLLGMVELRQDLNSDLKDKTNREGLVENPAFAHFKLLVHTCIRQLEAVYQPDREKIKLWLEGKTQARKAELAKRREELANLLDKAVPQEDPDASIVTGDADSSPGVDASQGAGASRSTDASAGAGAAAGAAVVGTSLAAATGLAVGAGALVGGAVGAIFGAVAGVFGGATLSEAGRKEIANVLRDSNKLDQAEQESYESERQALLSLAGLGFTAERFAHEFTRLVDKAERAFDSIERQLGVQNQDVMTVRTVLEALRNELRGLEPLMYTRRRKRNQTSKVMAAVENAVLLNDLLAADSKVDIHTLASEDFTVAMNAGALTQVLNNLLDNAIFWTSRNRAGKDRKIEIVVDSENSTIVVRDSGPGIAPHLADTVFDPFVTQRTDGRGLGLWICRQVLAEDKCRIQLLPSDLKVNPLGGAAFLLDLSRARVQ